VWYHSPTTCLSQPWLTIQSSIATLLTNMKQARDVRFGMFPKHKPISLACLIVLCLVLSSCVVDSTGITETTELQQAPELANDFMPPTGKASGLGRYGPWNSRLMLAYSHDGLNFTRANRIVTDQGDVPDLVRDSRGWLYLYYTGWTVGPYLNRTAVAISTDNGASWVFKYVNVDGLEPGLAAPVDPDVQILDDGTFRLYVTSDPHDGAGPRTYYAEGDDGINFVLEGVAFQRRGRMVLDPSTLRIGDTWHLFAGGAAPQMNWYATSTDGKTFAYQSLRQFAGNDGLSYVVANALAVDDGYRFYAFGRWGIVSFFTTEGATWTPEEGYRLQIDTSTDLESWQVKDPAVVRLQDGSYLMIYVTIIP